MSLSSSSRVHFKNIAIVFGLCLWVIAGFFVAQYIVFFAWQGVESSGFFPIAIHNQTLIQLILLATAYALALGLVVGAPILLRIVRPTFMQLKEEIAVDKPMPISDIGRSVMGYAAYFLLTIAFALIVQSLWRGFNADQAQEIGFKDLINPLEYFLAFLALVVIPPIVEELLFRGYLFGHVRKRTGFWLSAIVVSAIFGLAHLQWNVGIDVFALSLVLCFLREKTGRLWAGMGLHMIKNAIAFTIIFLHPDLFRFLGGGS